MRYLGKDPNSGGYRRWINEKIILLNLDTSHFTSRVRINGRLQYTTNKMLAENSTIRRQTVRKYILRNNLIPYKCSFCGNTGEWRGKQISLELDHINGINNDNRLENLRFLCPNCHATTDTYAWKNR